MSECQTKAGNQECLAKLAKLTLAISHSFTLDMLNNFFFHVYAQKSLFIGQNVNGFFLTSSSSPPDIRVHRAGSQLKIQHFQGY